MNAQTAMPFHVRKHRANTEKTINKRLCSEWQRLQCAQGKRLSPPYELRRRVAVSANEKLRVRELSSGFPIKSPRTRLPCFATRRGTLINLVQLQAASRHSCQFSQKPLRKGGRGGGGGTNNSDRRFPQSWRGVASGDDLTPTNS